MSSSTGWNAYKKLLLEAHADNKKRLDRIDQSIMDLRIDVIKIVTKDKVRSAIFGTIGGGIVTAIAFTISIIF